MLKRFGLILPNVQRQFRTALNLIKTNRLQGVLEVILILNRRIFAISQPPPKAFDRSLCPSPDQSVRSIFVTRVLIIATLDIPQCEKYRAQQKRMLLKLLGVECTVLPVCDFAACMNALQTHSIAIFYRVPGYDHVLAMIREAKRLGVPTIYEVDDLIFDLDSYLNNKNIDRLSEALRRSVLEGIPLFRKALTCCDAGIASTEELAAKMSEAGLKVVHVIENGIDEETMKIVEKVEVDRIRDPNLIRIFYGSGSKAHDADFDCAAKSIVAVAQRFSQVRIRVVGDLTLTGDFDSIQTQVERYPITEYAGYLKLLSECDINVAPLSEGIFNDCKSNIKFIEAALFEIPSVCSPRSAFRKAIVSGETGILAETADEWTSALINLIDSNERRTTMGRRSKQAALDRYSPAQLAQRDVRPFVDVYGSGKRKPLKILMANIFFSPESFGGGTIIAEEMAIRLNTRQDTSVLVFSGSQDNTMRPYDLIRREEKGVPVISVKIPVPAPRELDFLNRKMEAIFQDLLAAYQPDVVHLHATQGLSASIANVCIDASIPYIITLHDAWWLCERQFMIKSDHKYCGQTRIDLDVCETCVSNISWTELRLNFLRGILTQASRLLAPSEFWRGVYVANDLLPDRVIVNKNGIQPPGPIAASPSRRDGRLRFGFVGGLGPVKGFDLIVKAFQEIDTANYELILVDNTMNLGYSSMNSMKNLRLKGTVTIVPAYTQDTIGDFFSKIDVLLFPSQWKESFGLTIREALVRDKWVISTDSGGTVEDIVDGVNGTIIPLDGNPSSLRDAIITLLSDPQKIIGHSNKYKAKIRDFDDQANELYSILKSVAQEQAARKLLRGPIQNRIPLRAGQSAI